MSWKIKYHSCLNCTKGLDCIVCNGWKQCYCCCHKYPKEKDHCCPYPRKDFCCH